MSKSVTVAREKVEIRTLCLPNTGLQHGTYSKSLYSMRIDHIQSYSSNTTNYVQDNCKCCGAAAQNASTNGRQSRGDHARCQVYVQYFLLASFVPLPRRSWFYSDPSGPYDGAYECVWCSNGGQQRYILPSVIRLVSPQAGDAKDKQH
jgi:hypothetical protein